MKNAAPLRQAGLIQVLMLRADCVLLPNSNSLAKTLNRLVAEQSRFFIGKLNEVAD